jgi:hypothetical protein
LLKLVAKPVNVHGDGRLVAERPPPHPLHQIGTGERLPGTGHEEGEQIELAHRQGQLAAGPPGPPGRHVDLDAP